MRLLLFNLVTDSGDPVLGFTSRWIAALAKRVEFIHVITMRSGRIEVPGNVRVHSLGKEKGHSEWRRGGVFYWHLWHVLRHDHIDICFSHMNPTFTVLAGPLLKARHVPIVTWYAHPSLTWILRVAHHLSDRIVSSLPTAYPFRHDKLTVIGQGIDTDLFCPDGLVVADHPPVILCVGRLSAVKDHVTLVRAVALLRGRLGRPFRVMILGAPTGPRDELYVRSLHEEIRKLGISDLVHFAPAVVQTGLPDWYRRCTVHVNLTPAGFGDKVAWEAMACGKPTFVANEDLRESLGDYADSLVFRHGDAADLAHRLVWMLSLDEQERLRIGGYLREQVVRLHSLHGLADRLVHIFADCTGLRWQS